jgi:hypothetical protein
METTAGWIESLFSRHTAAHALSSGFLLKTAYRLIAQEADSKPEARSALRTVALARLLRDEEDAASYSVIVLAVVGLPPDRVVLEPLLDHPSDPVRRAARACLFELKRPERSSPPSSTD